MVQGSEVQGFSPAVKGCRPDQKKLTLKIEKRALMLNSPEVDKSRREEYYPSLKKIEQRETILPPSPFHAG